ncbi:MAG: hypothetical protein AB7V58_19325, partial [Solirubrobacterales bacterium]
MPSTVDIAANGNLAVRALRPPTVVALDGRLEGQAHLDNATDESALLPTRFVFTPIAGTNATPGVKSNQDRSAPMCRARGKAATESSAS